jgi:hypothetical protein
MRQPLLFYFPQGGKSAFDLLSLYENFHYFLKFPIAVYVQSCSNSDYSKLKVS